MKRNHFFTLLCALVLTVGLLIPSAAAAEGPQLVVSSQQAAASQTVGFSDLPADCQSLQATFTLSADASYTFTAAPALAGREGVYTTYKQSGREVTVYVTAKTGTIATGGSLTLGTLSASGGASFTVEKAAGLKVLGADNTEQTYPSEGSGGSTGGSTGGSGSTSARPITLSPVSGGKVTASATQAVQGTVVALTATPDAGYVLDSLTVTDASGKAVALTEKGNNQYTFVMPASAVTVKAAFAAQTTDPEFPFADVLPGSWYYEGVRYAYEHGLMSGTGEGQFSPDLTTSRGMIVTILYRLAGSPAVSHSAAFSDVAEGQWYADGVAWASANGVVSGYTDGRFRPNDTITREQMAAILYQYARLQGKLDDSRADLSVFADIGTLSAYAQEPMSWAVAQGLFSGLSADILAPGGSTTRAQAAVILTAFARSLG